MFQTRPYWMPVFTGMTIEVVAEFFNNFSHTRLQKCRATVDGDGLAGHKIAERRCEEEHCADQILR